MERNTLPLTRIIPSPPRSLRQIMWQMTDGVFCILSPLGFCLPSPIITEPGLPAYEAVLNSVLNNGSSIVKPTFFKDRLLSFSY